MAIKFLNTVSVDSSVLHVDAATDRVGIGTASPGAKLDVNGEIRASLFKDRDNTAYYINPSGSTSAILAGNVGIGTTSPSQKLTVSGNILATGTITGSNLSGTNTGDQDLSVYYTKTESDGRFVNVTGDTMTGILNMGSSGITGANFNISGVNQLSINDPGEGIVWNGGSSGNITLATVDDASDNILRLSGTGASLQVGTNTVWHAGNDGTGSGLDADKLDGQQGSYYYPASNPNGYTTNVGDITGVTAGTNLNGGGTSGSVTLNLDSNINVDEVNIGQGIELRESTDRADLLQITSATSTWAGIQVRNSANEGRWSFMTDGSSSGFYDDENGDWSVMLSENSGVTLFHNGSNKFYTYSGGVVTTGVSQINNDTTSTTLPTLQMTNDSGGDIFTRLYEENTGHAWMSGMDVSDGAKYKFAYAADGNSLTTGTKMTITTDGKVGIGTSAPARTFHISEAAPVIGGTSTNNSSGIRYDTVGTASLTHRFQYNGSTQVTIDNSGRMGIGVSPTQKLQVDGNALADKFMLTSSVYSELFLGQMATTGLIRVGVGGGGSWAPVYASAFNVMSDYRLKSNVVTLGGAIDRIKQLNVYRFNWNDKLDEDKVDGFIAHELATVIPEAVTGEKDALHEDGTEDHQGVDQAKVVPLLTAALKEAIEKIEQLETRIQTLENNN